MKDAEKLKRLKESIALRIATMDSCVIHAPSAAMKKVSGQDAVDGQNQREGNGEILLTLYQRDMGYVIQVQVLRT